MRSVIALILLLAGSLASADDHLLTVLGVYKGSQSEGDILKMQAALAGLRTAWRDSVPSPIAIVLANNGVPVRNDAISGSTASAIASWRDTYTGNNTINTSIRGDADIVVLFADEIESGVCGSANEGWYNQTAFAPDPTLDLTYADTAYAAVANVADGGCFNYDTDRTIVAHEVGHLLGGDHQDGTPHGMFPNSANMSVASKADTWGGSPAIYGTALTDHGTCSGCTLFLEYSTPFGHGSYSHWNTYGFQQVAKSVANYRATGAPEDPVIRAPWNITGHQVTQCDPWYGTIHYMQWDPDPDTNVSVDSYNFYGNSSWPWVGGSWNWALDVPGNVTSEYIVVYEGDFNMRLDAYSSEIGNSDLSAEAYNAYWTCSY